MSVQVKRRRDTASNVAAYTGAQGELVVDTTNNRVTLHDGSTAGGWPHALETRRAVVDANYTAAPTDRLVAYTALTASRIVTLPAAASYPGGARLTVVDESGAASATLTIALQRGGSDTVNGGASIAIATGYGSVTLESNGTNTWTVLNPAQPPMAAILAIRPKWLAGQAGCRRAAGFRPNRRQRDGVDADSRRRPGPRSFIARRYANHRRNVVLDRLHRQHERLRLQSWRQRRFNQRGAHRAQSVL